MLSWCQRPKEVKKTLTSDSCAEDKVYSIRCTAIVTCEGRTGVEMEALTAVTIGLLTVWDMLKAVAGKDMEIGGIMVMRKSGGSGDFERHPVS
jgi:molybdenum cofactor biosynthesis enzyme